MPVTLSTPAKRRYTPSDFDGIDTENVDPALLDFSNKKAKGSEGFPVKPVKASQFALTKALPSPVPRPIITPSRLLMPQPSLTQQPRVAQASSAPAAAGRSPKSKRVGILSRRRITSSPFTRIDPPSFGTSDGLPFSIDAALSGTVASHKPKVRRHAEITRLEETMPKGWMFDIYEDTEEEDIGNIMEHSVCTLDISDDEGRFGKEDRGKENVPPPDFSAAVNIPDDAGPRSTSRRDMMADEPRTPLGDLDAEEFYPQGCDASSYSIISEEKLNEKPVVNVPTTIEPVQDYTPSRPDTEANIETRFSWEDLIAKVEASKKANVATALASASLGNIDTANIEIWESESAKGEDEETTQDSSCVLPEQSMALGTSSIFLASGEKDMVDVSNL